ncbi:hypothetical protein AWRI1631_74000 [Saccharomyces cerevisiae AWRI1631]|uniref:Uncharacterized protein n=1 Tax=Saccharomyces cerevisiae (strain AWRI1631) TaxID=545124 RepID=B5VJC1_YEAS6|nr:hypothetical protein AWRI1631_74000 [Saccharomyces cerevisiae AWRI1631]
MGLKKEEEIFRPMSLQVLWQLALALLWVPSGIPEGYPSKE